MLWGKGVGENKESAPCQCCLNPLQFCKHLKKVSQSLTLVLVGDFNFQDVCWKYGTAERKQSRSFLECVEDNLLTQLMREPTREGTLLDLLFKNREGLVGDVVSGGLLGHNGYEMVEFSMLEKVGKGGDGVSRSAGLL